MKVAIILGGQPRFTEAFKILMQQLQGFDQADFFMCLWKTDWASTSQEARSKIEPMLLPNYNLKNLIVMSQPQYQLPQCKKDHPTEDKGGVRWYYKRRYGMWLSSYIAYHLIDQKYDLVIKARGDGRLDRAVNLSSIDLSPKLIFPSYPRHGHPGGEICDQFVFGSHEGMAFYVDMVNKMNDYIPQVCSFWEDDPHEWASEHLLNWHLVQNNLPQCIGDYKHILKYEGRSSFDDKDTHLGIGSVPQI
jgi:hypothetical protein